MRWVMRQISAQATGLFLWAPVLFGCGIALYFSRMGPPSPEWLAIWVCGIILALICGVQQFSLTLRWLSFGAIWFIFGYLNAALRAALVAAPVLGWNYYGPIEGRVVGIDRSSSNAPRMILDEISLPGERGAALPARIRLTAVGRISEYALEPGQRIVTTGFISPPEAAVEPGGFDFRRFAWFNKFGAIGYSRNPVLLAWPRAKRFDFEIALLRLRMEIADWTRAGIPGVDGAFAAAIISGDRSEIDPSVLTNLRASNLAHLLAISGLHMGLLSGFVFMILRFVLGLIPGLALRWPIKKYAALGALFAAAGYLLLSGANVATQRAFIMSAVVLGAVIVDRPALTLRAVAIAALLVLLIRPESLMEAGFQMSFAATTALVASYRMMNGRGLFRHGGPRWKKVLAWCFGVFLTSAIGGFSTAPYSALNFNTMAQFGLLANVLAVPVMGLLVMPAAVVAALLVPVGLDGPALYIMGLGIGWILMVADWVAHMDGAVRPIIAAHWSVLGLVTLAGLMLCLMRGPLRLSGLVVMGLALVIWSHATRPDVLIDPDGRLLGIMTDSGRALNKATAYSYAAGSWLQSDGDAASQDIAFARSGIETYQGGSRATLRNGWQIVLHWGRDAPAIECAAQVLFVFSVHNHEMAGPCSTISPDVFKSGGARAIWITETGLSVVPTLSPDQHHYWQVQ